MPSHAHMTGAANFNLVMFKLKLDVFKRREPAAARGEGRHMKSIHRSILARALMTGVASLALWWSARGVFARRS